MKQRDLLSLSILAALGFASACTTQAQTQSATTVDDTLVVRCELPGYIRRVGARAQIYVPGPVERLEAVVCGIRGGKFDVYESSNYEDVIVKWRGEAERGDATAQYYLGEMYERGLGTDVDYSEAARWYAAAAEQGLRAAQTNLGMLYEQGLGVEQDRATALSWYRKAAGLADLIVQDELVAAVEEPGQLAPAIYILEPPVPATRGVDVVAVGAASGQQLLIGRVDAPAGLDALTINGRDVEVDRGARFEQAVALEANGTDVKIVAIDQDGRRAQRQLTLTPADGASNPATQLALGRYHALVIGNNDYAELNDLRTAVPDARRVAELLGDRYGFSVTLLLDANRSTILDSLNNLRRALTSDDNLLIYYAGHGFLDEKTDRGYWQPVDAELQSNTNWIPQVVISDMLKSMNVRHVMVVADSCYSGALTRSAQLALRAGQTSREKTRYYQSLLGSQSRTALTSGGLAPVLDGGGGEHSVFAAQFIDILANNDSILEGQRLFLQIRERVVLAAGDREFEQQPQYGSIKHSGHESGDFLLVPRSARLAAAPSEDAVGD
ncbi:MAG: caspase family protein [Pseudomonadota bacterium]